MRIDRSAFLLLAVASTLWGASTLHAAYTLTVTADHGSVRVYPNKDQYDEGERVRPDS